jgi:ligand-binding sensor domain-containing protein/two-component sensor histidine kinase
MKKNKFFKYLNYGIFIIALIGVLSCNKQQKALNTTILQPKIVLANGYEVPQDSMKAPIVVKLHNPKVAKAGKPKLISLNSEVFKLSNLQKPRLVKPIINISGQNGFSLPQKVELRPQKTKLGNPEVILAKAPFFKEGNEKNIAIFGLMHGLKNKNITQTLQDSLGNLWIATGFGGFTKYDGKTFTNYSESAGLLNNSVFKMILDHKGNFWLSTYEGAVMFDGENFVNYTKKAGLLDNIILRVYEDRKHNIWLTTEKGVSRIDPQRKYITHFTQKNGLAYDFTSSILEDSNGDIWIGTLEHGISILSIKQGANGEEFTFKNIDTSDGLVDNTIASFLEDKNQTMWIGTDHGVSKYALNENLIQNYGPENGFLDSEVRQIYESTDGKLYFATANGLVWFNSSNAEVFGSMTVKDGLSDNSILSIFEDNVHNLWIGTENGLSKYHPNNFAFISFANTPNLNMAFSFLEDSKRNLWIGTTWGLIKYVPDKKGTSGKYYHYTSKEGVTDNTIYSLLEDSKGNIWIGTRGEGVIKYEPNKDTFSYFSEEQGLHCNIVASILEDEGGNIWFGLLEDEKGGVNKFDGETFTFYGKAQGLGSRDVTAVTQDKKKNFWFGSWGAGITKFEPKANQGKGKFIHFKKGLGLSNDKVRPILADKNGTIWIGTIGGGVNKYEEGKDGKPATFTHYSKQNGLSSDDVRSILEDSHGNLWFGTMYGLSKINNKIDSDNKLFKSYTLDEGFTGLGCYFNAIIQEKSNRIWIGTLDKITVFDPSKIENESEIDEVQLTDIKLFNEKTSWLKDTTYMLRNGVEVGDFSFESLSKLYQIPDKLSLPYNNNFLTFDFVGINPNTPQTVKYKFFLDGLDQDWSAVSATSEASYGNLPDGNYTLKVKALNGKGIWSKELNYSFRIRPPFWQTWWAYLLYFLVISASVYAFIQARVKQRLQKIKDLESIRLGISSNLHDDVGSILSGLAMQCQMMALTALTEQKASLLELSNMSHDAMERMRDTVWAIDSRKDKYENLVDRMRAFAEKNLNLLLIKHHFEVLVDDPKKFIEPDKRQNIYLIFKEAVTNICKHSSAKNVNIQLKQEKNNLYMLVKDNGTPKESTNNEGMGLNNMKMRAKSIGADLEYGFLDGFWVELSMKI